MFTNNKILILGFARSGYEAAKFLAKRGNEVVLNDMKTDHEQEKIDELEALGVKIVLGSHPDDLLDKTYDYLIKNPGVPIDHKYVLKARELGIEVINEVEMAYHLLPENVEIIGITGTNGKTTTTTLTYNIFKEAYGDRVHLAGNIGFPLSSIVEDVKDNDIIVIECSCQQGENFKYFHPHVGVCTNFTEAHIDFMKTYEHYKYVKSKILKNHTSKNVAILNKENEEVLNITKDAKSTKKYFSSKQKIEGSYLENNKIYYYNEEIVDIKNIKLRGIHNLENIMAAVMAVKEFDCSTKAIQEVLKDFKGVEHRLEYVCNVKGRTFYNDTEATNIKCTQIALASFTEPTIIILGGLERGQNFNDLKPFSKNIKAIIAMGQCKERVKDFAEAINKPVYMAEYITDATEKAYEISDEGDVILLSPGSASWDQYKECEERGALFKKTAKELNK